MPKVKQVGYYSDAYKLEFVLPKFNMFRKILAEVLADDAIRGRGWSTDRALGPGPAGPPGEPPADLRPGRIEHLNAELRPRVPVSSLGKL